MVNSEYLQGCLVRVPLPVKLVQCFDYHILGVLLVQYTEGHWLRHAIYSS